MGYQQFLNSWQKRFSKNSALVKVAVKIRNQANRVIAYSLATAHDPHVNGEEQLIRQIAHQLQCIVDVGANKGEWTLLAKKYAPVDAGFYLIEPGTAAFNILRSVAVENISVHHLGLSDTNGELDFYEEENAGEQSSFIISTYHRQYSIVKVQVQTLDNFCRENEIQAIDFLKIDCEGFDYKVLAGAQCLLKENRIRYIQFEYGSGWKIAGATLKAAIMFLNKLGYRVWSVSPKGLKEFDVDYYGEYFEYSNFFAAKELPKDAVIHN